MPTYECTLCNFSTLLKSNYTNHVASKKHIRFTQLEDIRKLSDNPEQPKTTQEQHPDNTETTKNNEKNPNEFTCKYCDQQFRFRQSMNRHIKYTCTKTKDEISKEGVELLKKRIEQHEMNIEIQKQMLHDIIDKQSLIIDKLMKNVEIQGSFNTTNNIQNIHLDTGNKLEELYKRLVEMHQDSCAKSTDSLETIL
jgi:mannitol-specific phosphotransferase system IIBC component